MRNCIQAKNFEELYNIHQINFNIGLMNIENIEPDNQRVFLANNFDELNTMFRCEIDKNNFEEDIKVIDNLYPYLNDSLDRQNLVQFVKYLVSNYADVTDAPTLGVTIEKVKTDMCCFYHCDMNSLRLVYPLLGPGTLWVSDENVNREHLGQGRNDLVLRNQNEVYQVPPKTITLLKGNGHMTGNNKAVVHASPKISETKEKRVLLRIESLYS